MSSSTDSPTPATHPFNNPKADLILRSSDNVEFRVFKTILLLSSPVFETMLDLPFTDRDATKEPTPVFPLEESSVILDSILRFCYPGDNPSIPDVETLELLVPVADKYCLDAVNQPLEALVVACRHGWSNLAQKVAEASLYFTVDELIRLSYCLGLDHGGIGSTAFLRLLKYHLQIRYKLTKATADKKALGHVPQSWATYVTHLAEEMSSSAPLRVLQEALSNPMKGLSTNCARCLDKEIRSSVEQFHEVLKKRVLGVIEDTHATAFGTGRGFEDTVGESEGTL
ncbi:hypothetical protein ONZ45_g7183 [Pleurotus djamor]|nr:hypothetical protein ONZ45_g7183 [Pleurotus djamor]